MTKTRFFTPFIDRKRKQHLSISVTTKAKFKTLYKGLNSAVKKLCDESGFIGKSGQIIIIRDNNGTAQSIIAGADKECCYDDGAKIFNELKANFSKETLDKLSFEIEADKLNSEQLDRLHIGWGWAAYSFDLYKKDNDDKKSLALVISKGADKKRINTFVESVCLIRDLVNIPANDMGPEELENATKTLTEKHDVELKVIKDKTLLTKNFPMIFDVGKASERRPRLLDFYWGNPKHPKVTLVGKGVCFDTGGLDIKPSQFMLTMKKDMGGSAHVLGLSHMIMSLNLPIRLRVLIPAVENSVSGNAYRPSDILKSRKGLSVEVGNTDAEGRLVLADALTYASEENPDLLIDFATLTGAARVALGHDLPALFSNNNKTAYKIQTMSAKINIDDAVWNLPLWQPYRKELDSTVADISSTGGKAGATTAALFLQEFIDNKIEWIHMDVFAWEQSGKTGRPKGGTDTGMRAIFAFLEDRYGT